MPLQRFIPSSSDRYISNDKNQGAVKFGHLNAVVDYINENGGGGTPAGTAGQIQFSDGSAFAADSNLFWDDTNKRLGVGTSSPTAAITIQGADGTVAQKIELLATNGSTRGYFYGTNAGTNLYGGGNGLYLGNTWYGSLMKLSYLGTVGIGTGTSDPTARLQVKGSGSTSATTALLVQNSSGTQLMKVQDNGVSTFGGNIINTGYYTYSSLFVGPLFYGNGYHVNTSGNAVFGSDTLVTSAQLAIDSTTKGFLPPRMTTTQKNAISTPAAGLVVYDNTLNQLSYFNGTSWVNV